MFRFVIVFGAFFVLIASQDITDEFPYLLSLAMTRVFDGDIITLGCGAVMINSYWALTTAMCASDIRIDLLYISTNNTYFIPLVDVVVHPNYAWASSGSDLALVKTAQPIDQYCVKCTPVQLATASANSGDRVTLTGWGYTNKSMVDYEILTADVTVIGAQDCNATYMEVNFAPIADTLFCAQNYFNVSSPVIWMLFGGAVMQNNQLFGIISQDRGFYYPSLPGLCSDVFKFNDWIQETIKT